MLQRWICQPLCSIERINCRQDCIDDLVRFPDAVKSFQQYVSVLPDIERLVSSVYRETGNAYNGETLPF